jgi:hypothetical protein
MVSVSLVFVLDAEVVHNEAEGDRIGGVAKEARNVGTLLVVRLG